MYYAIDEDEGNTINAETDNETFDEDYAKSCLMDLGLTEDEAETEVNNYYDIY